MHLDKALLARLETPCVVIDVEQADRNIHAMQRIADEAGCRLRPHIKTHKMPFFARRQIAAGASGITCAKLSEAEVMANGGLKDIFIAYPQVGAFRVQRIIALAKSLKRLILGVDSMACATALNDAALEAGIRLEIRLELDTGARRSGVPLEEAPALAEELVKLQGLELSGIYTFKSLVYQGKPTGDAGLAAEEECRLMTKLGRDLAERGITVRDISGGSSPTGPAVAQKGGINEIRPGTYIFKDLLLCDEKAALMPELAARFAVTVVSCPRPEYAVIDGGTKCFPTDIPLNTPPFYYTGYAVVDEMEHLRLDRMNEEHGIITSTRGATGLRVGQILTLAPIHICTAINMQNQVYLLENGTLRRQPVEGRGMLV
jgi:D-serine deaminase-like pyridoxal phosphate-dependent protein